jgi:hypothetical protein
MHQLNLFISCPVLLFLTLSAEVCLFRFLKVSLHLFTSLTKHTAYIQFLGYSYTCLSISQKQDYVEGE